jgi:hypothetical protein
VIVQDPKTLSEYESTLQIPRRPEVPDLSTDQVAKISDLVFLNHEPVRAEVLFVFGTVQADWDGLASAILTGFFEHVILVGRLGPTYFSDQVPISHIMRKEFVDRGIPADSLLIQETSNNTLEDVTHSLDLIGNPRSITFAAKSHHSGRCGKTLRKFFPEIPLNAWTHDAVHQGKTISLSAWHTHDEGRERVYGEFLRIQTYSKRGDIATDM